MCPSCDLIRCVVHVLTLKQPWAWAVFHAGKDVENRSAPTPLRGRLYIHAGLKTDLDAVVALRDAGYEVPSQFVHGVIIGHVELIDCVTHAISPWAQPGSSHWLLRDPQLLGTPIKHRGLPFLHKRKD